MDRAGVGEMAEALATPAPDQEFGTVLDHATGAILNAQSFEAPYPLILFRDFFPGEFYRRLLEALSRERPVRPTERGGDAKAIQSL